MKRFLVILMIICSVFMFSSCGNKNDENDESDSESNNSEESGAESDTHQCTFDASHEVHAPTCEEEGYTLCTCTCGETKKDMITAATGHSWNAWQIEAEPTLFEKGVLKRRCNNGHDEFIDLPALNKINYTVKSTDGQPINAHCLIPTEVYYIYNTLIYDDAEDKSITLQFIGDYFIDHTCTDKYVYSTNKHYLLCNVCLALVTAGSAAHSITNGTCSVCSYNNGIMYSEEAYGIAASYDANEASVVIPKLFVASDTNPTATPVKGIKSFASNQNLQNITIPKSIEYIEDEAFSGCGSLSAVYYQGTWDTWCRIHFGEKANPMNYAERFYLQDKANGYLQIEKIVLPNTLTSISAFAFEGFTSITSLTIPKSITQMGGTDAPFSPDTCIGSVYYEGDVNDWCNVTFGARHSNPMQFTANFYFTDENGQYCKPTEIEIPDTISAIGDYQFIGLGTIKMLAFNSDLTKIGDYAFYRCVSLSQINICGECTKIGSYAFAECTVLSTVFLPKSISVIESFSFDGCLMLESIYFGGLPSDWDKIDIDESNTVLLTKEIYYYTQNFENESLS